MNIFIVELDRFIHSSLAVANGQLIRPFAAAEWDWDAVKVKLPVLVWILALTSFLLHLDLDLELGQVRVITTNTANHS